MGRVVNKHIKNNTTSFYVIPQVCQSFTFCPNCMFDLSNLITIVDSCMANTYQYIQHLQRKLEELFKYMQLGVICGSDTKELSVQ
jgi:hypothetical protein